MLTGRSYSVLYETLRYQPPVVAIPKQSSEDTTLTIHNLNGETKGLPLPQGTAMAIHVPGMHRNRTSSPLTSGRRAP